MSLGQELQYVVELARGAGKIVLEHFGHARRLTKTHSAATKEAVTEADRASQRFIVAGLRKRFANDGVIGEENETGDGITFECPDPNGRVWVIDPVDGTNNFVAGLRAFCVCIGLLEAGRPLMGVVFDVCQDQVYAAARGEGAWLDNRKLAAVAGPMDETSLLMITSNLLDKNKRVPGYLIRWFGQTDWKLRILGSAALEAVQVAAGVGAGAVTVDGKLWDGAAPGA